MTLTRDASMHADVHRAQIFVGFNITFIFVIFSFRGQGDHPRSIEALRCQDICRYWPTLADVSQMVSRCARISQDFTTALH